MLTPKDYIGALMELAQERRGEFKEMKFITEIRGSLVYDLPLAEVFSCEIDKQLLLISKQSIHHFGDAYNSMNLYGSCCRWWVTSLTS